MTNKDEELYTAVITKIKELIPQLQPTRTMSDWERGSRNAFKHAYITWNKTLWMLVPLYTSDMETHTAVWLGL